MLYIAICCFFFRRHKSWLSSRQFPTCKPAFFFFFFFFFSLPLDLFSGSFNMVVCSVLRPRTEVEFFCPDFTSSCHQFRGIWGRSVVSLRNMNRKPRPCKFFGRECSKYRVIFMHGKRVAELIPALSVGIEVLLFSFLFLLFLAWVYPTLICP